MHIWKYHNEPLCTTLKKEREKKVDTKAILEKSSRPLQAPMDYPTAQPSLAKLVLAASFQP
jgi:hypothetical protein